MVSQDGLYTVPSQTFQSVENALLDLWDKAKRAADMILSLRDSNAKLLEHIKTLERTIEDLHQQLHSKELEFEQISAAGFPGRVGTTEGTFTLSEAEREALEKRITQLLERLRAHV